MIVVYLATKTRKHKKLEKSVGLAKEGGVEFLRVTKTTSGFGHRLSFSRKYRTVRLNNSTNWKIQKGLPIKIELDENFGYFLGIFIADGTIDRETNSVIITNKCKRVHNKIKKFVKSIGLDEIGRASCRERV